MGIHTTKYKTENGKTRKVKGPAAKPTGKDGAPDKTGVGNKNQPPENPAKQGA
jgi:hypothetical protein